MKIKNKTGLVALSLVTILGSAGAMLNNNTTSVNAEYVPVEGISTTITYGEGVQYVNAETGGIIILYYDSTDANYSMFFQSGNDSAALWCDGTLSVDDSGNNIITFTKYFNTYGIGGEESTKKIYINENSISMSYMNMSIGKLDYRHYIKEEIDVTSDNESAINQYIIDNKMKTEAEYLEYGESQYTAGYEAKDITSNDKEIYDKAYADGVASVEKDILTDTEVEVDVSTEKEEKGSFKKGFISFANWIEKYLLFGWVVRN